MILFVHVIIAVISLAWAGVTVVQPSKDKLRINYLIISGTLISGLGLMLIERKTVVRTCMTGLVYLAVVMFISAWAKRRLVAIK